MLLLFTLLLRYDEDTRKRFKQFGYVEYCMAYCDEIQNLHNNRNEI